MKKVLAVIAATCAIASAAVSIATARADGGGWHCTPPITVDGHTYLGDCYHTGVMPSPTPSWSPGPVENCPTGALCRYPAADLPPADQAPVLRLPNASAARPHGAIPS